MKLLSGRHPSGPHLRPLCRSHLRVSQEQRGISKAKGHWSHPRFTLPWLVAQRRSQRLRRRRSEDQATRGCLFTASVSGLGVGGNQIALSTQVLMPHGRCPAQPLLQQPGSLHRASSRTGRSTDPPGTFPGSSPQDRGQAPAQDQRPPPLLPAPRLVCQHRDVVGFQMATPSCSHARLPVQGQLSGPRGGASPTPPPNCTALGAPQNGLALYSLFL